MGPAHSDLVFTKLP